MTIAFWVLAGVMVAAALAALLHPLLRSRVPPSPPGRDLRLESYRARLAELRQEVAAGALSPTEAQVAERETERELLHAVQPETAPAVRSTGPARRTAVALLLAVPAATLALYGYLGQPSLLEADAGGHPEMAELGAVVQHLEERLKGSPGDVQGWRLLARSYMTMGRAGDAVTALERLHESRPEHAGVMLDLAQSLAAVHDGRYSGRPAKLVEQALSLEPQNPDALWLSGVAAMEAGDADRAVSYWQALVPLIQSPETAQVVQALIARVQNGAPTAPAAAAGKAFRVRVRVELGAALGSEDLSGATVFVTARPAGGAGMPLAVARLQAQELPLEITLDESNLMVPGTTVGDQDRFDISARISRSGRAERQPGDFIGETNGVAAGDNSVATVIVGSRVP
jgi:cytochrome c-type biogenesis protein CcmH